MTEEQFKQGSEHYHALQGVKYVIDDLNKSTDKDILTAHISYPHWIDDAITTDIKNIIHEHSAKIKAEILECLKLHVIRIQHDLDQV